ncbi:MAG: hypothetical protein JWQ04_1346, partial [Pedosphaera sp.]|nr:hypothetical protein [Pedosphaera sp.]
SVNLNIAGDNFDMGKAAVRCRFSRDGLTVFDEEILFAAIIKKMTS